MGDVQICNALILPILLEYMFPAAKVYLLPVRPHLERRVYWILMSPLTLFQIW